MEMRVTTQAKSQSSLGTKRDRARNDKRFHQLPGPAAKQIKRTCRVNRQIGHASPFSSSPGHKTVIHKHHVYHLWCLASDESKSYNTTNSHL